MSALSHLRAVQRMNAINAAVQPYVETGIRKSLEAIRITVLDTVTLLG
jgi:hypothetical protein